jgi:hypothetical protein
MSNKHITAVNHCSHPLLKGNARLLLFVLADAASNGSGKSLHGAGWTSKSLPTLMQNMGTRRRDTVEQAMATLATIGVIERKRRRNESCLTFVDLDWLIRHQDVPESVPSKSETGGTGKRDVRETVSSAQSDNQDVTEFVQDVPESVHQDVPDSGTLTGFEPSSRTEEISKHEENRLGIDVPFVDGFGEMETFQKAKPRARATTKSKSKPPSPQWTTPTFQITLRATAAYRALIAAEEYSF